MHGGKGTTFFRDSSVLHFIFQDTNIENRLLAAKKIMKNSSNCQTRVKGWNSSEEGHR